MLSHDIYQNQLFDHHKDLLFGPKVSGGTSNWVDFNGVKYSLGDMVHGMMRIFYLNLEKSNGSHRVIQNVFSLVLKSILTLLKRNL